MQCFGLQLFVLRVICDLLDFVVIIVLIFYILTILEFYAEKCLMPSALQSFFYPYLPAFYIIVASAICVALLYTKRGTSGWGVLIMLLYPIYYLTKGKE
jgi:APA family basic amino acid/polyamine antiporter